MNIQKKYISKYILRNLICVGLFALLMFVCLGLGITIETRSISLYNFKLVLIFTLSFTIIAFFVFLFSLVYIIRFKKTIKAQEQKFNIIFNDNNAILLSKQALNYLSDEWYIQAGSLAIYYKNIKSMALKSHYSRSNTTYSIIFKTKDGHKYKVGIEKTTHYNKIRKWYNNLKEISKQ